MKADYPQWAPALLAIQFLTRLPVPPLARLSGEQVKAAFPRAVRWVPLVGAIVGSSTAATVLLAEQFWPRVVAVILALIVEARLTGAFHEDAVADFCDGIGGGRDPEHARQIMKDSRIGSYGACGLLLAVALRASLMISLQAPFVWAAIIAASTFGRLVTTVAIAVTPPAPRFEGLANDVAVGVGRRDVTFAFLAASPGLLPFIVIAPVPTLLAFLGAAVFLPWFRSLVIRRAGGSTGDCFGFVAHAGQLIFLLASTATAVTTS